jgi:hypothetical protein
MSHTDMGIVGATTDTFILFENGVRRNRLVLPGLSNAADCHSACNIIDPRIASSGIPMAIVVRIIRKGGRPRSGK